MTQTPSRAALESDLLKAHDQGDGAALVALYARAAQMAKADQDIDRAGFYLTHAWIFALECGHPKANAIRDELRQHIESLNGGDHGETVAVLEHWDREIVDSLHQLSIEEAPVAVGQKAAEVDTHLWEDLGVASALRTT